jgi:polyphosphate glucokinase
MAPKVLAIDVGGTHVKILATGHRTPLKIASGTTMTARKMCAWVKAAAKDNDWPYDVAAIGYPGPVVHGRPVREPYNLGEGWVAFDYGKALGCPVKIINDAAMQALGSYHGGRMLFLGLGTGLGSAMMVDGVVEPMELGHLPYKHGKTYEHYLGLRGLERMGKKKWREYVIRVVEELKTLSTRTMLCSEAATRRKSKSCHRKRGWETMRMHFSEGIVCGLEKRQLKRAIRQANIEANGDCAVEFPLWPSRDRRVVQLHCFFAES